VLRSLQLCGKLRSSSLLASDWYYVFKFTAICFIKGTLIFRSYARRIQIDNARFAGLQVGGNRLPLSDTSSCPSSTPIQLGAISIGDKLSSLGMVGMDKESSVRLLDAYFDNGGNTE
jgi:hypothetical protein